MNNKNKESILNNKWIRRVGLGIVVLSNIALVVFLFRNLFVSEKNPETHRSEVLSEVPQLSEHDRVEGRSNGAGSVQTAITPNLREVWVAEADIMTTPDVSDALEIQKDSTRPSFNVIKTVKHLPSRKSSKDKKSLKTRKPRLSKKSTAVKSNSNKAKKKRVGTRPGSNNEGVVGTVPFETIVVIAPVRKPFPDFDPALLRFAQAVSLPGFVQNAPGGSNTLTVIQDEGDNTATLFQETQTGDNRASISQTRTANQ